jgi:hypothetical protein
MQLVLHARLFGLCRRRLLLHAGDLVGEGMLSACKIGIKRGNFLLDGLTLRHDLGIQYTKLGTQRIPLREKVTNALDKLVCLSDVVDQLPELTETLRKLAHGSSSVRMTCFGFADWHTALPRDISISRSGSTRKVHRQANRFVNCAG